MQFQHEHLTRQLDLIPVELLNKPITIIGAGAIGSFAALQLVKAGFTNLEVWDHDKVSVENMSCQFYRFADIGQYKVMALYNLVKDFTNESIKIRAELWQAESTLRGIVVVAVDSMEVREQIFTQIKAGCFQVEHIIDPRMGAETALMYTMNPWTEEEVYRKTLYTDANAVQERCTAKSTIYTANLLSGLVTKAVKNLVCKQPYPRVTHWDIGANQMNSYTKDFQ